LGVGVGGVVEVEERKGERMALYNHPKLTGFDDLEQQHQREGRERRADIIGTRKDSRVWKKDARLVHRRRVVRRTDSVA
jgi:hypothetical protein